MATAHQKHSKYSIFSRNLIYNKRQQQKQTTPAIIMTFRQQTEAQAGNKVAQMRVCVCVCSSSSSQKFT